MQRKDITVGLEVAVADHYEWTRHRVIRAKVVAVEVISGRWSNSPDRTVVRLTTVGDNPYRISVPAGNLRGPWNPVGVEATARFNAAADQSRRESQARQEAERRAETAANRARVAGYGSASARAIGNDRVSISAADLTDLLDRLDRAEGR
jgi:hypothetical protein